MAAPFQHSSVSSLMGSWPTVPGLSPGGTPSILPRTLLGQARILGARKEPADGYDVVGQSFYLWVDVAGSPTQFQVLFSGTGNLSLQNVVDQINATAGIPTVAFRDNSFLRLESPASGESSYLHLQTDISSDVLYELGLFAETTSRGGDLMPACTIQAETQVALPGQLSWMEGESFESKVFNRALFQLGINTDRSEGLLSQKRIAIGNELDTNYSETSPAGLYLSDYVYTGTTVTPTPEQLEKWFVVLDEDGRELIKENKITIGSNVATFSVEIDTNDTLVTATGSWSPGGSGFTNTDPQSDMYVVPSGLTGAAAVLNGVPLKIIQYRSTNVVGISPVDPATGNLIVISPSQTGKSFTRTRIDTLKCQVDGIYDEQGGDRIESVQRPRCPPNQITRIDLGNRVLCDGSTFSSSGVVVGDLVLLDSAENFVPYSNNGWYRVANVIDEETLELVTADWGPVVLNPNVSVGYSGDITVMTDGAFWDTPFIQFKADGALPADGQPIKILYSRLSSIRDATNDPAVFISQGVQYDSRADDTVQKAILCIIGPSATTIDQYVRNDRRNNLEDLGIRLDREHYGAPNHDGRHSTIRPDVINMFPNVLGTNITMWDGNGEEVGTALKMRLRSHDDTYNNFALAGNGNIQVGPLDYRDSPAYGVHMMVGLSVVNEMPPPSIDDYGAQNDLVGGLPTGTYHYCIAALDIDGNESVASSEVTVVVSPPNDSAYLYWIEYSGAVNFRIYRRTSGSYTQYRETTAAILQHSFIDCNQGSFLSGTPKTTSQACSMKLNGGPGMKSWMGSQLSINGAGTYSILNVEGGDTNSIVTLSRSAGLINQGLGPNLEGQGSPAVVYYMDAGVNPGDAILYTWYARWTGTDWTQVMGEYVTDGLLSYWDADDNERFRFDFEDGATFRIYSDTTDSIYLYNTNSDYEWGMGVDPSAGHFYLKGYDSSRYSLQANPTSGFMAICPTSPYFDPQAPIDIQGINTSTNVVLNAMAVGRYPIFQIEREESAGGVADGSILGVLRWKGAYNPATYGAPYNAGILATAVGAYTGSSSGTKLTFSTTPNGSITQRYGMDLRDSGTLFLNYDLSFSMPQFDRWINNVPVGPQLSSAAPSHSELTISSSITRVVVEPIDANTQVRAMVTRKNMCWVAGYRSDSVIVWRMVSNPNFSWDSGTWWVPGSTSYRYAKDMLVLGNYLYILCETSGGAAVVMKCKIDDLTTNFNGKLTFLGATTVSNTSVQMLSDGMYLYVVTTNGTTGVFGTKLYAYPTLDTLPAIINTRAYTAAGTCTLGPSCAVLHRGYLVVLVDYNSFASAQWLMSYVNWGTTTGMNVWGTPAVLTNAQAGSALGTDGAFIYLICRDSGTNYVLRKYWFDDNYGLQYWVSQTYTGWGAGYFPSFRIYCDESQVLVSYIWVDESGSWYQLRSYNKHSLTGGTVPVSPGGVVASNATHWFIGGQLADPDLGTLIRIGK